MSKRKAAPYHIFMLGLSLYVLVALAAQVFFTLSPETLEILDIVDFGVCLVFLADFARTLARAENRGKYMLTWGWIDLLSSLPTLDVCRWGRTARIFRILRLLRGLRATRILATFILERKAECAFWTTALLAVLVIVASSIGIIHIEKAVGGNITTGPEALWWAFVTVTTVGYGDLYPVSNAGRALAASLMLVGIGVFGTFTAYLATSFLATEEVEQDARLDKMSQELTELRKLLEDLKPSQQDPSAQE